MDNNNGKPGVKFERLGGHISTEDIPTLTDVAEPNCLIWENTNKTRVAKQQFAIGFMTGAEDFKIQQLWRGSDGVGFCKLVWRDVDEVRLSDEDWNKKELPYKG